MPTLLFRPSAAAFLPMLWPDKAAAQIDDYILDLSAWVGASSIASLSVAIAPPAAGLTLLAVSYSPKAATIRLGGGAAGSVCTLCFLVSAADGRQMPVDTSLTVNSIGEAAALPGLPVSVMASYPTAPAGLPPGSVWSNGGVLCIT
jgi:hypothetical protein